ncbi:Quinic acid utilization activator [Lachnellula suecica]|uniref:Quinic acid utilization activator n=1 Tax=Lachnellula suecica TaxID=602035 RepID=A0A8T9C9T5_9HELO|nr:Quinic acid utilization activator [Lachnellula suecica]
MAQSANVEDTKVGQEAPAGDDEDSISKPKKSKQVPRKRVSQACDRCRSRKDKCDGKKPACSTCLSNGRECSYDANVKKRGLPEGYVRGLEKLWGLAIRDGNHIETDMLSILDGNGVEDGGSLKAWNDEGNSENLVGTWRKSQLSKELETLLSSLELAPENGKRKRVDSEVMASRKLNHSGPSKSINVDVMRFQNEENRTEIRPTWPEEQLDIRSLQEVQSRPSARQLPPRDSATILTPSYFNPSASSSTPASNTDVPDLPSETWHLLDVYFSYTHTWLPIIEKHDLLRTSYQYSQNQGSASSSSEHAVLWAAIAYAKFQHRAINNIPRAQGAVRDAVWTAERMYSHARVLIPNEEGTLELGHVQALLILTLANIGMGHLGRAWSLIGQAVRAAIDLELDKMPDSDQNSHKAKSRAKHVFLGCFAIETIIAARLGRRPHLRADDVDAVGPIDEDGLEEWDPWTDCLSVRRGSSGNSRIPASILSTFNRLVQVLKILSEAICSLGKSNHLQLSAGLLEKLHIWSRGQSSPLYFDSSAIRSDQYLSLLPHHHHLHTTYFTTLAKSQLLAHDYGRESVDLEPCTRSARQIAELVKQHSQTFGLLIVPPTYEYFVKTAYDVVNEVRSSIDNTHIVLNDWKHSLDLCLDSLEPAWPVFETLRSSASNHALSESRRKSEVAFDLITGASQVETPQSLASFETSSAYSPHPMMPVGNMQRPRTMSQNMNAPQQPLKRAVSLSRSGQGLPMPPGYEDVRSLFNQTVRPLSSSTAGMTSIDEISRACPSINQTQQPSLDPRRQPLSTVSEADTDPLANEFAALDAMEWTGNWDQSLLNLGFTDRDNMNQDFYAFCQEPDPLHPNNVFQQLAASSNAEATNFFDGSAFTNMAGAGMGMGGFGGLVSVDENEGIEAGQILQALSAAEEQRAPGTANG